MPKLNALSSFRTSWKALSAAWRSAPMLAAVVLMLVPVAVDKIIAPLTESESGIVMWAARIPWYGHFLWVAFLASVALNWMLLKAFVAHFAKPLLTGVELREKRDVVRSWLESKWQPSADRETFGPALLVDTDDEHFPEPTGADKTRPENMKSGNIFGIAQGRYLEIIDGYTSAELDTSTGKWRILAQENEFNRLIRVGLVPLEWIESNELHAAGNLIQLFCRFEGKHGPYEKMMLYQTSRRADNQVHKAPVVDYDTALRNSFPWWVRLWKGYGRRVFP